MPMSFGYVDAASEDDPATVIGRALDLGVTMFDTADVYGPFTNEELLGRALERRRHEATIATKVGLVVGESGGYPLQRDGRPEHIAEAVRASLRRLRTDVIDLYYLHHCDFGPADEYFDDALALVRRFREEGKVRFIGLSDWDAPKIMRFIDRVDPDVVQPYRNVVDDDYVSSGLRSWVEAHDAGVAFFSPIMHGLLLGKYDAPVVFPEGDFRSNVPGFGDAAVIERMKSAREAVEKRWAGRPQPVLNALIGALLSDSPTGCVLLGQRNPSQVDSAAAAGEPLSNEEAEWVRKLYREA
jgi:aryl-alcohol dehydrogenase-like predicted oxidoreductase